MLYLKLKRIIAKAKHKKLIKIALTKEEDTRLKELCDKIKIKPDSRIRKRALSDINELIKNYPPNLINPFLSITEKNKIDLIEIIQDYSFMEYDFIELTHNQLKRKLKNPIGYLLRDEGNIFKKENLQDLEQLGYIIDYDGLLDKLGY